MRVSPCIGVILFAAFGAVAQPSVELRLDSDTVQVNSSFIITIETKGGKIDDPVIPDVEGLTIEKTPSQTSSQMQFSMNLSGTSMVRARELGYQAVATRIGRVRIPPIEVRIDGKKLLTKAVALKVVKEAKPLVPAPAKPRPGRPSGPRPGAGAPEQTELGWDKVAFIAATVDKEDVYQGQPVVLRLRFWRIDVAGVRVSPKLDAIRYPDTEGFYATKFKESASRQEREEWRYVVTEHRQLLYPASTGQLTIGSWRWQGTARAFTRRGAQWHDFDLSTQPITITVRPLPERPEDFSGAVGDFRFEARLSRNEIVQGVPVMLTLAVTGQGNPDAIGEPHLPQIKGSYVSDPQKETQPRDDGAGVEKTIVYSITPLEATDMTIPEISFCYFDPKAEAYKTLKQGPFTVGVLASAESDHRVLVGESGLLEGNAVDVIGVDLRPIVTEPGRLRPYRTSVPANTAFFAAPVLCYAGLALWVRRRRRFERDTGFARDYYAKSKGRKRLKAIEQADDPSEELYHALIGFIADKFNVSEAGMTSNDAGELFRSRGVDVEIENTFTKILRACERARYASAGLSPDEVRAMQTAALPVMDALEDALKNSRRRGAPRQGDQA